MSPLGLLLFQVWIGGGLLGLLILPIYLGWQSGSNGPTLDSSEILMIVVGIVLWWVVVAAALLVLPTIGLHRLGRLLRKRHDFWPKVMRRLGGNR